MKKIVTTFLFSYFGFATLAQEVTVALNHLGASTMYYGTSALNDAITNALNGDTIYAPGTSVFAGITINKSITLYGPGVSPDSTTATGKCIVNGVTFANGSGGASLEGFYVNGSITFNPNEQTNNVTVRRNYVTSAINFAASSLALKDDQVIIEQNVIAGSVDFDGSTNVNLNNNIIGGILYNIISNGYIANNVFHYAAGGWWIPRPFTNINNSLVINNIFLNSTDAYEVCNGSFNQFQNNIFPSSSAGNSANNFFTNNHYSVNTAALFIGQTVAYSFFNYTDDYHLASPGTYASWNNEGVGIYGGVRPWKIHILPQNPHIKSKTIAGSTDVNGDLNINISIKAQDN